MCQAWGWFGGGVVGTPGAPKEHWLRTALREVKQVTLNHFLPMANVKHHSGWTLACRRGNVLEYLLQRSRTVPG